MIPSSLTVLMTVYNGLPYLKDAVQSILEQSLQNFTFLILNNGSTDGTGAWLEELEKKYPATQTPRLTVVHLPKNVGRTAVLNKGLSLVNSDITAIMDADDLAAPERLAKQMVFFQQHPETTLLGSDVLYIDSKGNILGEDKFPSEHQTLCNNLPLHNQFAHSATAYRTDAARAADGYPEAYPYAQDMGLWIAMLQQGGLAASLAEPLTRIRMHPGQATRDIKLLMVRAKDNHNLAEAMLHIPGLSKAARQAALARSGGALWSLGHKRNALDRFWKCFCEAPLLLPGNPLFWRRLAMEARRYMSRERKAR